MKVWRLCFGSVPGIRTYSVVWSQHVFDGEGFSVRKVRAGEGDPPVPGGPGRVQQL